MPKIFEIDKGAKDMSKNYVDYMVEETKNILAIDSPSGYTKEVADYVMGEYKKLGYEPKLR